MQTVEERLAQESIGATELIAGKSVARVVRDRIGSVLIEFTDGTRLFVDESEDGLEISIT